MGVGWDLVCSPMVRPAAASQTSLSSALQDDTISINHNWVNGCNLPNMWHFLQQELQAVQHEVEEWKDSMPDWHHHRQVGSNQIILSRPWGQHRCQGQAP